MRSPLTRRQLMLGAGALGLGWLGGRRLPWMASGALPQQAYVWQRAWGAPVEQAVREAREDVSGLIVLGAEARWQEDLLRVVQVPFHGEVLARSGLPIGIALRIHERRGPLGDREAALIREHLEPSLARASVAGVPVAEIQIDLDCPTSRLGEYRRWMALLRDRLPGQKLTFTALPSWLKHPSFQALCSAADGYVLQVHGLARPSARRAVLFERDSARRALDLAGALGWSFRLALPTYTYSVAFDEDRQLAGVSAEGAGVWAEDLEVRRVAAPAPEVAALVRSILQGRPSALSGLVWYRLPVKGDTLNWSMSTLRAVQRGEAPRAVVRGEAVLVADGAWQVRLHNEGTDSAFLRGDVRVSWEDGRVLAADSYAGVEPGRSGALFKVFHLPKELALMPGERRELGWIRLEGGHDVVVQVSDEASG